MERILAQFRAIAIAIVVLLVAGALTAMRLPEEVYPTLSISRVLVEAQAGSVSPQLVQTSITLPLRNALQSVLGVERIESRSSQGVSKITVSFDPAVADTNVALQRVSTAVAEVRPALPPETRISIQQIDPSLYPITSYALSAPAVGQMQLRNAALYELRPQLLGIPGVAAITVLGGRVQEYLVSAHPGLLAAHGITMSALTTAIARANAVQAVGHTDNGYVRSTLLATGQAHNAQQIAAIPITERDGIPITVGMVARVSQAPGPPKWAARSGGTSAVLVNVFAQRGASFPAVAAAVNGAMRRILPDLAGIHIVRFWNQATLVSNAIGSLRDAIVAGLILSTLVIFFFLRNWSATLIAALVIPLTIVITLFIMGPLHEGLNLMTLGGLAVGVGLIIDDAIVVVENVYRHLAMTEDRIAAVTRAVNEIASPMISSTLTTIVVFAPLTLLSGIPGAFFKALAATLAVALVVSLALAFLLTPALAAKMLRSGQGRFDWPPEAFRTRYERILRYALGHRAQVWAIALLVLAATVALGTRIGSDFLPRLDEGAFEMEFRLPPGATLSESSAVAARLAEIVRSDPAVRTEATVVGLPFTVMDNPGGVNTGKLRATLLPKGTRPPIWDVIARIQRRVHREVPVVHVATKQVLEDMLGEISNVAAPIEIQIFGPRQSTLVPLASEIAARLRTIPALSGVSSGVVYQNPDVVMQSNSLGTVLGVSPADIALGSNAAFDGDVVSSVVRGPANVPVRVRYDLPIDPSLAEVRDTPVVTPGGAVVPLDRVADITTSRPETNISELNGRRFIAVTAQIAQGNLSSAVAGIRKALETLPLPPHYTVRIAGSYALQKRSFSQLALVIGLSVLLVFIVMLVQFRSFIQPIAILLSVPCALFGVVLALLVTGISLDISSLMGLIVLVGLVVKNGILLLEYATRRQKEGDDVITALLYATRIRLRPILMTTLAALLGMLPLGFAIGSGSEMLQPLAVAVLGGLSFATVFTLVLIPVAYVSILHGIARWGGSARVMPLAPRGSETNA